MKLNNEKLKKDGSTRFQLSVIFLFVTFSIVILFSLFYFLLTFDINETSGLGLFIIGIIIMYSGLIASGISSISALCGSLLGISSVKYLSAKKMKIWAIIVSIANVISFLISFIYFLSFSSALT